MNTLQFKTKTAQRIYDDYINRSNRVIKRLSVEDREDCIMEINSYIFEFLSNNSDKDETENILNILERLGSPEDTLRNVMIAKKTQQAIKTLNPKYLVQALWLNMSNGFIYILLFVLFLFGVSFPILSILKVLYPAKVGCFIGDNTFLFGFANNKNNTPEILGYWFVPITILLSIVLYFSIIFLLKLKSKIRQTNFNVIASYS